MISFAQTVVAASPSMRCNSCLRSGRDSRAVQRTIPREPRPHAFSIFIPVMGGTSEMSMDSMRARAGPRGGPGPGPDRREPWINMREPMLEQILPLDRPLVVFDTETTGTNPRLDRIVEIACVQVHPDWRARDIVR